MDSFSSDLGVSLEDQPLAGTKAVEHFVRLDQAQKYHYISHILKPNSRPPVGEQLSLRHLPDIWSKHFLLSRRLYDFQRYDYTRRSLLTATLFLQRPLTQQETDAVTYWSTKENKDNIYFIQLLCLAGAWDLSLYIKLLRKSSGSLDAYARNILSTRSFAGLYHTAHQFGRQMPPVLVPFLLPWGIWWLVSRPRWKEEMQDSRLSALKAAVDRGETKLAKGSYRASMVPKRAVTPGFREVFWTASTRDEWQRLKYGADAFVKPPLDSHAELNPGFDEI